MLFAELEQFLERVGRRPGGEHLGVVADGAVDDGAAVARAGRRVDRIERHQAQNVFGVDRVGIAQPVLDGGDRQACGRASTFGVGAGRSAGFTCAG